MAEKHISYKVWRVPSKFRPWRWELVYDFRDPELLWAVLGLRPYDDACDTWRSERGKAFTERNAESKAIRLAQRATQRLYNERAAKEAEHGADPKIWARITDG